ncbi:hypothetical protein [Polaribacter aquimarinus]|uniref:Uncharacterized protein n=1 Tax=Polaribacter aquimarinus TaxID=2100726 RepID=A0A2U2J963_9FLAO|nr:hypothetical protein [Polaribacter aquimarinus]PWG04886.1 hypothetical protein DIS07_10470 [Polaribacter aquimarinus]
MSNLSFSISEVVLNNPDNTGNNWSPILYAYNSNNIEWGSICSSLNNPISNYPILENGGTYPGVSYLQLTCQSGQYQLYYTMASGKAYITAQCITSPKPYPNNQMALWNGSASTKFKLIIDLKATSELTGISLQAI